MLDKISVPFLTTATLVSSQLDSIARINSSLTLCLEDALVEAGVSAEDLSAVAVTYGPGLVGSLLIGISAAKAFAWAHQLPLISEAIGVPKQKP